MVLTFLKLHFYIQVTLKLKLFCINMLPPPIQTSILSFLTQHRLLSSAHNWWLHLSAYCAKYILFCQPYNVPSSGFVAPALCTVLYSKSTRSPAQITSPCNMGYLHFNSLSIDIQDTTWETAISIEHELEMATQFSSNAKLKRALHFLNKKNYKQF